MLTSFIGSQQHAQCISWWIFPHFLRDPHATGYSFIRLVTRKGPGVFNRLISSVTFCLIFQSSLDLHLYLYTILTSCLQSIDLSFSSWNSINNPKHMIVIWTFLLNQRPCWLTKLITCNNLYSSTTWLTFPLMFPPIITKAYCSNIFSRLSPSCAWTMC